MTTTYVLYFEHGSESFRHTVTKTFNDKNATQVIRNMIKYFERLEKDVFIPSLKTHKLHGNMSKVYACSVNYDFRIIFSFDSKYVYLESIGTHDEV